MTDLELAADKLTQAGWIVQRPPFDDPYEVLYRRMQKAGCGTGFLHEDDDPTSSTYDFGEFDQAALAFLKAHFIIRPVE